MGFSSGGGSTSGGPAGGDAQGAAASSNLSLTTTPANIPGATLTLARAGLYLIHAIFDFTLTAGDSGMTLTGTLVANGVAQGAVASFCADAPTAASPRASVAQQWLLQVTAGQVLQLQATKSGGTGTSQARNRHTSLSAVWIKP